MSIPFFSKKHYVFCGDTQNSMLAEVEKSGGGKLSLKTIATEDGPPTNPDVINRLILQTSPSAGNVSMAFPLQVFEVLSLSLPLLPDDAIERTLPYHIAKAIDKPLTDYIYDWQVNKRFKEQMQVSVYLFPRNIYKSIEHEFLANHLEVTHFEADVFAAFSYLDLQKILNENESTMCVMVWPDSLTLAVCEAGRIELVRTVDISIPQDTGFTTDSSISETTLVENVSEQNTPDIHEDNLLNNEIAIDSDLGQSISIDNDEESDSILAGFQLISPETHSPENSAEQLTLEIESSDDNILELDDSGTEVPTKTPMDDYLDLVSVEIMRTRDYFGTVIKGKQIQNYYALGADDFFEELSVLLESNMGEKLKKVITESSKSHCSPSLQAVGLGAGTRW